MIIYVDVLVSRGLTCSSNQEMDKKGVLIIVLGNFQISSKSMNL